MDPEELRQALEPVLYPEPDEDQFGGAYPHRRLADVHQLDCTYWSSYEASSGSRLTRLIAKANDPLLQSVQSLTVPGSLSVAAIRLFGDSLVYYADEDHTRDGFGSFRYFPSVLITFWASFEAFVRLQSEMFVAMAEKLPAAVSLALLEEEEYVDDRGRIRRRSRRRPVMERYAMLLQFAFSHSVDRGARYWQRGEQAVAARDSLAHYHIADAPSITCRKLWEHLEAIALLWIEPSSKVGRSVYYQQFDCYEMLAELHPFLHDFEERPLHKGWLNSGGVLVYAPFDNLSADRYPPGGILDPARFSIGRMRRERTRSGKSPE